MNATHLHSGMVPDSAPDAAAPRIVGRALLGSIEVTAKAPQQLLREVETIRARLLEAKP